MKVKDIDDIDCKIPKWSNYETTFKHLQHMTNNTNKKVMIY